MDIECQPCGIFEGISHPQEVEAIYTDTFVESEYKDALLDYIICGCRLRFRFLSKSLLFTTNPGLYTPMSPFSLPDGHIFTTILSYGFLSLRIFASVSSSEGVGGAKIEVGMDLNG